MAIKIAPAQAREVLAWAVLVAQGDSELPVEWESHARTVFRFDAKTYTPALGTLLLAKAVDSSVDTLAIKATEEEGSYSFRNLGHVVLVPVAASSRFSLRTTGREPLNNQPFLRAEHLSTMDPKRVKNEKQFRSFLSIARRANELSTEDARLALAAFVRVASDEYAKIESVIVKITGLTPDGARVAAEDFLRSDSRDRPQRLQAFAAACLDLGHVDVRSRRINDPSRDVPGDVQVYSQKVVTLSMEVRGKAVPKTEFDAFIDSCAGASIGRAMLFVDAPQHRPIDLEKLESYALSTSAVQASVFETVAQLVEAALAWADLPISTATARFADRMLDRLREIEVRRETLDEWARVIAIVQAH